MTPIKSSILNNNSKLNSIWIMRQAGRYLPEFREIRKENSDFIKLCLNSNLSSEITLQPLERFDLDAAIIFSDILMIPYALGQRVEFMKNFGPKLGDLKLKDIENVSEKDFSNKLKPIYKLIEIIKSKSIIKNKDIIGFVGAPWTLALYMINKISPKKNDKNIAFENIEEVRKIIKIITKFIKLHILNQVKSGATLIQIFDSWAGLLDEKFLDDFIYSPTLEIVEFTKTLNVPVICFPREIKDYKIYCKNINPDVISIDYNVDPNEIRKDIDICVQGGMDPKILLSDKEKIKNEAKKYLDIFKDGPYIFNLGHGVMPDTKPEMVDYLVKFVKNY